MKVYWYISDAKLDTLKQTLPRTWTQDLVVKLKFKAPWFEAEIGHRDLKATVANVGIIEEHLNANNQMKAFEDLENGDSPIFISFRGQAARMIFEDGYWVALRCKNSALLLGGSIKHAIGASNTSKGTINPSVSPFGAAGEISPTGFPKGIEANLSYAWQEVFRTGGGASEGTTPTVEGIAMFAGRLPASRAQVRRIKGPSIEHLVVATPIYIRQV